VGAVSDADKSAFFESGRALLFPVLWPEPFGLVVVESLLSGTPVLASRVGSLPELIPDGAGVGELISPDDEAAWVEAIGRVKLKNTWKKDVCRKWAEENFHFQKMSEGYEKIYVRIREGERL
jgi:glycosyltransferase involved in cell wall biosynthesis